MSKDWCYYLSIHFSYSILCQTSTLYCMKSSQKRSVLLIGPEISAVSGVSTHLRQIMASQLSQQACISHFQIGSEGRNQSIAQKVLRLLSDPIRLWREISHKRVDLVHINSSLDRKAYWRDIVFLFVTKLARVESIFQLHGGQAPIDFCCGSQFLSSMMGKIFSLSNYFVVLTTTESENYSELVTKDKLFQIPNCIDQRVTKKLPEKSFSDTTLGLAYIGRLVTTKGIYELADALRLVKESGMRNFIFSVAGDGPDKDSWLSYLSDCGLDKELNYVGSVSGDEKQAFWRSAEVLLLPSYSEGLPYSVLEALAYGVPVIASNVGGIPDAVEHGVHGLIVEPQNSESIAAAIRQIDETSNGLKRMSNACRSKAEDCYSIDNLVAGFAPLYLGTTNAQ